MRIQSMLGSGMLRRQELPTPCRNPARPHSGLGFGRNQRVPRVFVRPLNQRPAHGASPPAAQPQEHSPVGQSSSSASSSSSSSAALPGVSPLVAAQLTSPHLESPNMSQLLKVSEAFWKNLRHSKDEPHKPGPTVVEQASGGLGAAPEFDVCICGGTLGVILALALQKLGHRVCIVEKLKLEGRNQEWNIGRRDLERLVSEGLLSAEELQQCVVSEFNPVRVGFVGMSEPIHVSGVLNLGVQPRLLLELLKNKFLAAGGTLLEHTAFKSAVVYQDGVLLRTLSASGSGSKAPRSGAGSSAGSQGRADPDLTLSPGDANRPLALAAAPAAAAAAHGSGGGRRGSSTLSCRLLLDCMGHYSPIVKQVRGGSKPAGMVVVVGGCMAGVPAEKNASADLLVSFRDSENDMQLFWEAFPAAGGDLRTCYMFTYMDAHPERPTLASLLDTYFRQLPEYQGVPLEQLHHKRLLFGAFPCYPGSSPLQPAFDRVLQVGDAAAGQSPLSFGGFGCMVKSLRRLRDGIHDALQADLLSQSDLALLQPYQPAVSAAWLFQRAMSVNVGMLQRQEAGNSRQQAGSGLSGHSSSREGSEGAEEVLQMASSSSSAGASSISNAIVAAPGLRHELAPADMEHAVPAATTSAGSGAGAGSSTWTGPVFGPRPGYRHVPVQQPAVPAASKTAATAVAESSAIRLQQKEQQQHGSTGVGSSSSAAQPHASWATNGSGSSHSSGNESSSFGSSSSGSTASSSPAAAAAAVSGEAASSAGAGGWMHPGHVNRLLRCNFGVMRFLGDGVMRPFLEDTLRFGPLALTMAGMSFRDPLVVVDVVRHLGVGALLSWTRHFLALGIYTLLHFTLHPFKRLLRSTQPELGPAAAAAAAAPCNDLGEHPLQEAQRVQQAPAAAAVAEASSAGGLGQWRSLALRWLLALRWARVRARYVMLRLLDALEAGSGME